MKCRSPPRSFGGLRVEYAPKIGDGSYGGMNCRAARWLGVAHPGCRVVRIASGQSCGAIKRTLRHEVLEQRLMEADPKLSYPEAHRRVTRLERNLRPSGRRL